MQHVAVLFEKKTVCEHLSDKNRNGRKERRKEGKKEGKKEKRKEGKEKGRKEGKKLVNTLQRICEYSTDVLNAIPEDTRKNLAMISKWGCDGSGNQATYKQRIAREDFDESSLLITCLVTLQLVALPDDTR